MSSGKRLTNTYVSALVLILLSAALLIAKSPELWIEPRLWAEDATKHFSAASENPWYIALFLPHQGYFAFAANLTGILGAKLLPLSLWPYAPLVVSFMIQLLPAILIAFSDTPFNTPGKKLLGVLVFTILATNASYQESWLNMVNSQFFLGLNVVLILVITSKTAWMRWLCRVTLVIAGLAGVLSAAMTPVFWLRYYQQRDRESLIQALCLTGAAAIQAGYFLHTMVTGGISPYRSSGFGAESLIGLYFIRTILANIGGQEITRLFLHDVLPGLDSTPDNLSIWVLGVYVLLVVAIGWLVLAAKAKENIRLLIVFFIITLTVYFGSIGDKTSFLHPEGHGRYLLIPNAIVILTLMIALFRYSVRYRGRRTAITLMVALFLISGAWDSLKKEPYYSSGPSWRKEVRKMEGRDYAELNIWPEEWKLFVCDPALCNRDTRKDIMPHAEFIDPATGKSFDSENVLPWADHKVHILAGTDGLIIRLPDIPPEEKKRNLLKFMIAVPEEREEKWLHLSYHVGKETITMERPLSKNNVVALELPAHAPVSDIAAHFNAGEGRYRLAEIKLYHAPMRGK